MNIAYVNGRYIPRHKAQVAMEDRGYQFADGIYEVAMFFNRQFLDLELHMNRLIYSLDALRIPLPMAEKSFRMVMHELVRRNPYKDGMIYVQITRGVAKRSHMYASDMKPSLTMSVGPVKTPSADAFEHGVSVITLPDTRWKRCDIKSISLLPNILARQQAADAGASEVFFYNDDHIMTEGTLSTVFVVRDGCVMTHPEGEAVLPGVRKQVVHDICAHYQIPYVETLIPMDDVFSADEVFVTSANSHILPITTIDGHEVAGGEVGGLTKRLLRYYQRHVSRQTGKQW